jgi:hypothetical protein
MRRMRNSALFCSLPLGAVLTFAYADSPERTTTGNSYYLYTGVLERSDAGVVAIPPRFKWSVETSWRGVDAHGKDLPDTRVVLRLYDPDQNFTALTAQMDLKTAEKLQRELADIIVKKRQNPDYQHRPQLWDASLVPTGRLKGIDDNGDAIIELEFVKEPKAAK